MSTLDGKQRARAIEAMRQLLAAPVDEEGMTPFRRSRAGDERRVQVIETEMAPLLASYLSGQADLPEFKSKADGINKRNALWGFKGIKGQMFFNMLVNAADEPDECDQELKAAIAVPANDAIASSRIKTFLSYVSRVGEQWVESGRSKHGRPKPGSIPFFLSYFWQVQDRNIWPVVSPR